MPETVGGIVYVSKDGGSDATKDGSSWDKAYAAADLKTAIDEAGTSATTARPYLVLVGPGTYTISATLSMKNHVLIAGAIAEDSSLSTDKTILDGGSSTQVFSNTGLDKSAVLYGVTITKGQASNGGGMYNTSSSPILTQVTFSANKASNNGGGMYNDGASPTLTQVVFSSNTVAVNGGGVYNRDSSPILRQVVFSQNTAPFGGGMSNYENSSPILNRVTFLGNTASAASGGGMLNLRSSPILTQVTFSGNTAAQNGGGMYNNINGGAGPTIVNSIFWGNTVVGTPATSSQIYVNNDTGSGTENLNIYNSVLEGGISGIGYRVAAVAPAAPASTNVVSSGIIATDPTLANTTLELFPGASVSIPTISTGSSAVDKGLYVQREGRTLYYSEDATKWYTGFNTGATAGTFTGVTAATLPSAAINLTEKDITDYTRTGRPDIGAYEAR